MRYEIERTVLRGNGPTSRRPPVERFIERGESAGDAVRRFLSRDRSVLSGDLITHGSETITTATNSDGEFLLRLQVVSDS